MLIGISLWPLAWAASISTYSHYRSTVNSTMNGDTGAWALPAGFLIWAAVFLLLPRPFRTYVLGHELTHALWAILMGGRVGRMKIGRSGGHVELSRTNFLITLAPYFFPFYTVLLIAVYYLAGIWLAVDSYPAWWLAAVGLTWSFHITFTIHMLTQQQPDVQEHGRLFSFTVIYIMNVLVIALLMILLGEPQFLAFGDVLSHEVVSAYRYAIRLVEQAWFYVEQWFVQPG